MNIDEGDWWDAAKRHVVGEPEDTRAIESWWIMGLALIIGFIYGLYKRLKDDE